MPHGEKVRVTLVISHNMLEIPLLLNTNPINGNGNDSPEGKLNVYRDNALNMMASKIVRNFHSDRFKCTDYVDIYNLTHANPPMYDFSKETANSDAPHKLPDLRNLRALIVAQMARHGMHRIGNDSDLLANFQPTEQNIQKFLSQMDKDINPDGQWATQESKREAAVLLLSSVRDLVLDAFNLEHSKQSRVENALTNAELNFLTHVHGFSVLPGNLGTQMEDPGIDTALLKTMAGKEHGDTHERYPELIPNLQRNFSMRAFGDSVNSRRNQIGDY